MGNITIHDPNIISIIPTKKPNVFKVWRNMDIGFIEINGSVVTAYFTNNNSPVPSQVYRDYLPNCFEEDGYTWKSDIYKDTYYTVIKYVFESVVHSGSEVKKWYYVTLSGEDDTDGYVRLTEKDAKIVAYATDKANWEGGNAQPWSGHFYIDTDHPRKSI